MFDVGIAGISGLLVGGLLGALGAGELARIPSRAAAEPSRRTASLANAAGGRAWLSCKAGATSTRTYCWTVSASSSPTP